jgi:predicted ABC-type ATPase
MAKVKRMRIFAGPNGSGKSTLFAEFSKHYNAGAFINADILEKVLTEKRLIDLSEFNIQASQTELDAFLSKASSQTLIEKTKLSNNPINIKVKENFIVSSSKESHSYEASLAAAFIRELVFNKGESFSFETVMSHTSKLEEIVNANALGYQCYLYFVCTDAPEINVSRVNNRVEKGGHSVDVEKIKERYKRTLENLFPATQLCYRSFLFDNSGKKPSLIAELYEGEELTLHTDSKNLPKWFINHLLSHFKTN